MDLLTLMQERRSIRNYTGEPIPEAALTAILQAGLLAPSGRAIRPWELIAVRDPGLLKEMAGCRTGAANMLTGAAAAIVVVADGEKTDVWTEDCSIVMAHMHLMASSLGVGSCWIQGRLREAADGGTSEDFLQKLLGYPAHFRLEAILSLGMPAKQPPKRELPALSADKIHWDAY